MLLKLTGKCHSVLFISLTIIPIIFQLKLRQFEFTGISCKGDRALRAQQDQEGP